MPKYFGTLEGLVHYSEPRGGCPKYAVMRTLGLKAKQNDVTEDASTKKDRTKTDHWADGGGPKTVRWLLPPEGVT